MDINESYDTLEHCNDVRCRCKSMNDAIRYMNNFYVLTREETKKCTLGLIEGEKDIYRYKDMNIIYSCMNIIDRNIKDARKNKDQCICNVLYELGNRLNKAFSKYNDLLDVWDYKIFELKKIFFEILRHKDLINNASSNKKHFSKISSRNYIKK